ncbi:DUF3034 family protein [Roseateles oligotrophus]|uniref:DUF3034 family protein n=1 Tax=Roseateles oligotrophus TaxID=1769250 RepID=A0ABT2YE88_9BURK|nr:DUF3034 family protein [Roseateles oligotrophus]MCV2368351.1 DUF3034 family protein [Roseateles oligotrophus]
MIASSLRSGLPAKLLRLTLLAALAVAASAQAESGKLLLTGGVSSIDGAAGGGLTPWAVTGSYATVGQWGATAHLTGVKTQDYALATYGVAVSWGDRLEVSLARQDFDAKDNLGALGLLGLHLKQDIIGVKLRVAGDAVLDSDTLMPQIALGLQHKRTDAGALSPTLFGPLGAKKSGTDIYLSATKLLLAQGILLNGTLRATKANQNGLLGFGGAQSSNYKLMPEVSLALLLSKHLVVGAEYRAKPDHLNQSVLGTGALKEDDWFDVFIAWAPNKHASFTLAYVDLGRIAPAVQPQRQTGTYLSAQFAY